MTFTDRLVSSRPLLVDLFCGAGGLSLGLHAAQFRPVLAVDASEMAAETYFRNFIDPSDAGWAAQRAATTSQQIRRGLAIATTEGVLADLDSVREVLDGADLDLLAGGPPCQGFSLAGLRNPEDQRNRLPFEFLRFVKELRPKAVLIENVTGIGARFYAARPSALEELSAALAITGPDGYLTQIVELDAVHFGVAQRRSRIMILGLRGDVASKHLVRPTDDMSGLLGAPRWSSASLSSDPPLLAPWREIVRSERTVMEALGDLDDHGYRYPEAVDYPPALADALALRIGSAFDPDSMAIRETPSHPPNHQLRRHGRRVQARFRVYIALAPYRIRENVFGLAVKHSNDVRSALTAARRVLELHGVPEPLSMPDGSPVLDEDGVDVGVNHAALTYALLSMSTGKHSQRALDLNRPAPTVLSLPDDFVHPVWPRTLSVREMARLQSFPDGFQFFGKATTGTFRRRFEVPQYTQVGNAVAPLVARAVGRLFARLVMPIAKDQQLSPVGATHLAME